MNIVNMTQHDATPEQAAAGVVEPADKAAVRLLLTFDELPSAAEVWRRASELAAIAGASGAEAAMIGGAPYLMGPLEKDLRDQGLRVLYSFTRRESVEERLPDGGVRKTNVFRHAGWVEA